MAFQQFKLDRSINQSRGIFDMYIYRPDNGDLSADVQVPGYFKASRFSHDWVDSIITIGVDDAYIVARIKEAGSLEVLFDSSTSGGSSVTAFNGRTGAIVPDKGDYLPFYLEKIDNVIPINSEADFPTQDANTITLGLPGELGKAYVFGADVTTAKNVIVAGNCVIKAETVFTKFEFSGAGAFITFTDCFLGIKDITLNAPNRVCLKGVSTSSYVFDHRVNLTNCFVDDCLNLLVSDGAGIITNTLQVQNVTDDALVFSAADVGICSLNQLGVFGLTAGKSMFKCDPLNTFFAILEMTDTAGFGDAGANFINCGVDSINILPGTLAIINGCNAASFTTPLVGATVDDDAIIFRDNSGIDNSVICGSSYLNAETTVAVSAAGTFYKINQTNWTAVKGCRLTVTNDGDFINSTSRTMVVKIDGYATLEKVGGGQDTIEARIVYDGNPSDPQSIATGNQTENTQPTSIPLTGLFTLAPQKGVSIWVANMDAITDISVTKASFATLEPV